MIADTPLVIHDLVVDRSSRGYGILEAALTAPQIVVSLSLLAEGGQECGDATGTLDDQAGGRGPTPVALVASSVLFAHAVYVIVTPRTASPKAVAIAPIVATDRERVAGLTVGFQFD